MQIALKLEHVASADFDWGLYPEAETFLQREVDRFLKHHGFAKSLSATMYEDTSTRFFDWVDHIVLPEREIKDRMLQELGFGEFDLETHQGLRVYKHTRTAFFPVLLSERNTTEIALKPENLEHFAQKAAERAKIEGERFGAYRKAELKRDDRYVLSSVERRGYDGFVVPEKKNDIVQYKKAFETFTRRRRVFSTDKEGMEAVGKLVGNVLKTLSPERAADAFFRAERIYWEKRNKAGQVQKIRLDRLGLGWGNHDHHTYRSSRENFVHLIHIFETLGFVCRERFFAGQKAGWGAQILEHPVCDIVLFADVDLTKEEKGRDFAHEGLESKKELGTVGLWVDLHGESILQSGMHHLEARFDFEKLRADMPKYGIEFMEPFSYFEFLKQAFTKAEKWPVAKERLDLLLKRGSINEYQHSTFLEEGAIGSHLENLQRTQGFKGFNQDSVSAILKATDPRKNLRRGA